LIEDRALLIEYRALSIECRALLIDYRAWLIFKEDYRAVSCDVGLCFPVPKKTGGLFEGDIKIFFFTM